MFVIIRKKMNLYWIIGLFGLWTGAITSDQVTAAPGVSTITSNEIYGFIISIKIMNRIYNDSLEDHHSQSYKLLRQDVENMFFELYRSSPSVNYQATAEMTFSNGSVIARSILIFKSKQQSGQTVKDIFVTNYKQHPFPLDLNINYTADQEPILVLNFPLSSPTASITSSHIFTSSEHNQDRNNFFSSIATISSSDKLKDDSSSRTSSPQIHPTTDGRGFTNSISQTTITPDNSNVPEHSSTFHSTMSTYSRSTVLTTGSSSISTTTHPSDKTSTVSKSGTLITTAHTSKNTSTISGSDTLITTAHTSNKAPTITGSGPLNTTAHPTSNISTMSASSSSVNPGKPVTQKPTGAEGSDTVATDQGVPGWGIAILVLAAIILFFMLVLLILLLLFWCCWWKQRGFMNVSDPDPTGYYNPDIPMYSTHSTYDSHNGKSLVADLERPSNHQTGTYE